MVCNIFHTERYHFIDHHPLIKEHSTYKTFAKLIKKRIDNGDGNNFILSRNCRCDILIDEKVSKEAKTYLNTELEFEFKGEKLTKEKTLLSDNSIVQMVSNAVSLRRNLSGSDLMQYCEDSNDSNDSTDLNKTFMNCGLPLNDVDNQNKRKVEYEENQKSSKLSKSSDPQLALSIINHAPNTFASNSETTSASFTSVLSINSLYNDVPKLKKIFGCFKLFQKIEAEVWIEKVEIYLNANYSSNLDEICKFFYVFLSDDYHEWFFEKNHGSFKTLKIDFVNKSFDLIKEYHDLMYSTQSKFIELVKKKYTIDEQTVKKSPIKCFFENKFKIFAKVCPNRDSKEIIVDCIMILDKDEDKKKFFSLRNLDIRDLITRIKYSDW